MGVTTEAYRAEFTGERVFRITITEDVLAKVQLAPFDQELLRAAEQPDASISDMLLALDAIVFNAQKQGLA